VPYVMIQFIPHKESGVLPLEMAVVE
jgi:hypothetical protein